MAKKSKIARNEQRKVVVDRYAAKRLRAEEGARRPERHRRVRARPLASACRSSPATRRRCACATATPSTAVPAETSAKFGISRVRFRDMAHRGELPGITKSSW